VPMGDVMGRINTLRTVMNQNEVLRHGCPNVLAQSVGHHGRSELDHDGRPNILPEVARTQNAVMWHELVRARESELRIDVREEWPIQPLCKPSDGRRVRMGG